MADFGGGKANLMMWISLLPIHLPMVMLGKLLWWRISFAFWRRKVLHRTRSVMIPYLFLFSFSYSRCQCHHTIIEIVSMWSLRSAQATHHSCVLSEPVFCRLDIAEIVVLPPASKTTKIPRHRRVDIIIGPHKTYGAAILGWTGSRQFERDLRLLAKHRGYKVGFSLFSHL